MPISPVGGPSGPVVPPTSPSTPAPPPPSGPILPSFLISPSLLPQPGISINDFSKAVAFAISSSKVAKNEADSAAENAELAFRLNSNQLASMYRQLNSAANSIQTQQTAVITNLNAQIATLNSTLSAYSASAQTEIDNLNTAIATYNAGAPTLPQQAALDSAIATYNSNISTIGNNYTSAVNAFNASLPAYNNQIATINSNRAIYGLTPLPTMPNITSSLNAPPPPTSPTYPFTQPVATLPPIAYVSTPNYNYITPVQQNLTNTINSQVTNFNTNVIAPGSSQYISAVNSLNNAISQYNGGTITAVQLQTAIDSYNTTISTLSANYTSSATTYNNQVAIDNNNIQTANSDAHTAFGGSAILIPESNVPSSISFPPGPLPPYTIPVASEAVISYPQAPTYLGDSSNQLPPVFDSSSLSSAVSFLATDDTARRYATDFRNFMRFIISHRQTSNLALLLDGKTSSPTTTSAFPGLLATGTVNSTTLGISLSNNLVTTASQYLDIAVTTKLINEIRNFTLGTLQNAQLSAVLPTLEQLQKELPGLSTQSTAIQTTQAGELIKKLLAIVNGANFSKEIAKLLEKNPQFANLPADVKASLIALFTASAKISLLKLAVFQLAIALKAPALPALLLPQLFPKGAPTATGTLPKGTAPLKPAIGAVAGKGAIVAKPAVPQQKPPANQNLTPFTTTSVLQPPAQNLVPTPSATSTLPQPTETTVANPLPTEATFTTTATLPQPTGVLPPVQTATQQPVVSPTQPSFVQNNTNETLPIPATPQPSPAPSTTLTPVPTAPVTSPVPTFTAPSNTAAPPLPEPLPSTAPLPAPLPTSLPTENLPAEPLLTDNTAANISAENNASEIISTESAAANISAENSASEANSADNLQSQINAENLQSEIQQEENIEKEESAQPAVSTVEVDNGTTNLTVTTDNAGNSSISLGESDTLVQSEEDQAIDNDNLNQDILTDDIAQSEESALANAPGPTTNNPPTSANAAANPALQQQLTANLNRTLQVNADTQQFNNRVEAIRQALTEADIAKQGIDADYQLFSNRLVSKGFTPEQARKLTLSAAETVITSKAPEVFSTQGNQTAFIVKSEELLTFLRSKNFVPGQTAAPAEQAAQAAPVAPAAPVQGAIAKAPAAGEFDVKALQDSLSQALVNARSLSTAQAGQIANKIVARLIPRTAEFENEDKLRQAIAIELQSKSTKLAVPFTRQEAKAVSQQVELTTPQQPSYPNALLSHPSTTPSTLSYSEASAAISNHITELLTPQIGAQKAETIANNLVRLLIEDKNGQAIQSNELNSPFSVRNTISKELDTVLQKNNINLRNEAAGQFRELLKPSIELYSFVQRLLDPANALIYSSLTGLMYSGGPKVPPLQINV